MTKVMIDGFGWISLVIAIDWYTKKIVGHYSGLQAKSDHWLKALDMAVNRQFPNGVREQNLKLMTDNGSQPTSTKFIKDCSLMKIKQGFTSYGNPKGNADTERVMRTIKEELVWLKEWTSPDLFFKAFNKWIIYYNNKYLHSTLGYMAPEKFEKNYFNILSQIAC
jgi:transposase InsO family protein